MSLLFLLLWDRNNISLAKRIEELIYTTDSPHDIIKVSYDELTNGNLSISDRLKKIQNEILTSGLKAL